MPRTTLPDRIAVDPDVAFGRPVVAGTRITAAHVLHLLAGGMTPDELVDEFPHLVRDDIQACLAFGADLAGRPFAEPA